MGAVTINSPFPCGRSVISLRRIIGLCRHGALIRKAALILVLATAILPLAATKALAVSADEPINGYAPVTAAQLEADLSLRNPGHIHPGIAEYYANWGPRFGIRSDVAFAQMLHETGSLHYGGVVQPWQNNFAGIGATDAQHQGASWPNAEAGVIGHYAHLAWFTYPNHVNAYCSNAWDPRHGNHRNSVHSIRDLGGQWAVPGYGYGDALARYASEFYYFTPGGNWRGNFNEVPGTPLAKLSTTFYFPWYDSKPANGMGGNWILIGNQGAGSATVEVWIGGERMHDPANPANEFFTIPEGGRVTPMFPDRMGGPVKVISISGQKLIASQRVIYRESFSELPGITAEHLGSSYEFTWYDAKRSDSMLGDWILIANQGSQPADVEVWLGDERLALYSTAQGNGLAPGAIVTPMFPETRGGPVRVVCTNGQPLLASQRVLYQESFSEILGYLSNTLASRYLFSWYDSEPANGMKGDWLLVANRGAGPADVNLYIDGTLMASYTTENGNALAPGSVVAPSFAGVTAGPVEIVSTNGQPLLVSQRVLFRDSFEEVQGIDAATATTEQFFPWYDSRTENSMGGDWLMITNPGGLGARVEIWIGEEKMHDPGNPGNDYFDIMWGSSITPQFPETMGGPVRVVSTNGQPVIASQRVLYKYNVIYCGSSPCG